MATSSRTFAMYSGVDLTSPATTATVSQSSQVSFLLILAYIATQVYLVPILPVGPSWAVWPCLSDIVIAVAAVYQLAKRPPKAALPDALTGISRMFWLIVLAAACSYVVFTLDPLGLNVVPTENNKGVNIGLFQLYRLLQIGCIATLARHAYVGPGQWSWIRKAVGIAYTATGLGMLLTYLKIVTTADLAPQLPTDLLVSGPWAIYSRGILESAVGAVGYHHVYPPLLLIVLGTLYIVLSGQSAFSNVVVLLTLPILCFISSSRAGFVAGVVCVLLCLQRRAVIFLGMVVIGALIGGAILLTEPDLSPFTDAYARQETIMDAYERDGVAGRDIIWAGRLELLDKNPIVWFTGTGFGAAYETGTNAHMLYLHIVLETGLPGLAAFVWLFTRIIKALRKCRGGGLLISGTVAMLISGVTQETFYPVSAIGHLLAMYAVAIVITIRLGECSATAATGMETAS
jgi:hypothetical protein